MKNKFLKGGRVPLVDPHSFVIDNIIQEDEALEKQNQKEKQHHQELDQEEHPHIIIEKPPKSKDEEIDLTSPADKIKILEKDKDKVAILQKIYIQFNMPGINKLYDLIHITHPTSTISRDECKTFLSVQTHEQLLKPQVVKSKMKSGHIIAWYPFEIIQMDIVFMNQYKKQNDNYKYFLVIVDVFTRKAFARGLKDKSNDEVKKEFLSIIKEMGTTPRKIMSDNDSTFLSNDFRNLCEKMNIILSPNVVGDHNYLGIVDRFCRTIKLIFAKLFIVNDNTNWIDHIQEVLDKFNDTPNQALDDITPNQALLKNHLNDVLDINLLKSLKNATVSDLVVGQFVRLKIGGKFTKSSEPQWSDNIYKVTNVNYNDITIDDGPIVRRNNLLVVPNTYVIAKNSNEEKIEGYINPIKKAQKDAYIDRTIKKSGVEKNDDKSELVDAVKGRERKKKVIHDV